MPFRNSKLTYLLQTSLGGACLPSLVRLFLSARLTALKSALAAVTRCILMEHNKRRACSSFHVLIVACPPPPRPPAPPPLPLQVPAARP